MNEAQDMIYKMLIDRSKIILGILIIFLILFIIEIVANVNFKIILITVILIYAVGHIALNLIYDLERWLSK